jgi:hypothetical protein
MAFTAESLIPILGMELLRPRPNYIARTVFEPQQVWDASAQPGKQVRLDRYGFFGADGSLTKDARRRRPDQLIGANNSRQLNKQELFIDIDEYSGPGGGDINDPSKPGNIRISFENIMLQQRNLYDVNVFQDPTRRHQFHQSIGSESLLDDYQRWMDSVYINEALQVTRRYNPGDVPDGGTYASGPPKFDVNNDLETIVEQLKLANVPTFSDGLYRALVHPTFLKHLRQDDKFTQVARYPGFSPIATMVDPTNAFAPLNMPHPNNVNAMNNPNALAFYGSLVGQNPGMGTLNQEMFPTGFVFGGVRFFESNNIPTELVTLTYTTSTNATKHPTGSATREGFPGIFFGQQLIGEALATNEPVRCKVNGNDDYGRFAIMIWQCFGGWSILNPDFGIVARSYGN